MTLPRLYEVREVLSDRDKTPIKEFSSTVATNAITITIDAVANKAHHIFDVVLSATTGGGAAEMLEIIDGSTRKVPLDFTVGTDREWHSSCPIGFVGEIGGAVTIKASATELTAGALSVIGYTK